MDWPWTLEAGIAFQLVLLGFNLWMNFDTIRRSRKLRKTAEKLNQDVEDFEARVRNLFDGP